MPPHSNTLRMIAQRSVLGSVLQNESDIMKTKCSPTSFMRVLTIYADEVWNIPQVLGDIRANLVVVPTMRSAAHQ